MRVVASIGSLIGIVGAVATASAADLPLAARSVPASAAGWSGFYVGGTIGYGWGNSDNTFSGSQTDILNPPVAFVTTSSAGVRGVLAGIEAGYNRQLGNLVVGVEVDFSVSGQQGTAAASGIFPVPAAASNQRFTQTESNKLRWLGTTRGRAGYAHERGLLFVTGGLAYGEVESRGIFLPPYQLLVPGFNSPITWDSSQTKVGWTVGAGAEYAVTPAFTWKLEYLYVDLGELKANASGGIGNTIGVGNCYGGPVCASYRIPASGTATSRFTDNILRFGMNYKFVL